MAAGIPRVLKNWNLFVDGDTYAGKCDEAELPEIKIKTEEHRAGGMDGSYEIDMGMETLSAKLTLAEYEASLIRKLGGDVRVILRGALRRDTDGQVVPVLVELHGTLKSFMSGNWKAGDKATAEHELSVNYFRWNQSGEDLIEIDIINMKRVIGGVDQLAGIRAALAM